MIDHMAYAKVAALPRQESSMESVHMTSPSAADPQATSVLRDPNVWQRTNSSKKSPKDRNNRRSLRKLLSLTVIKK
jgi:hypothetical protein